MAQNPFDQLSKQYLEEFLTPIGQVRRNLEVPGEAKFVDVYFAPNPNEPPTNQDLGLLGRLAQTLCSLEPFRNPPTRTEIRTCLLKLLWLQEDERRKAKQENRKLSEADLPQLWILAATATQPVIADADAKTHPDWLPGIYFLPKLLKTAIVAIDQLPATEETLWLRILGRGVTQERAIREVLALPPTHPRRNGILRLLASWKVKIDVGEIVDFSEQEGLMALSEAFVAWEQATETRSRNEGRQEEGRSLIRRQLARCIGDLPDRILDQINTLSLEQLESLGEALLDFACVEDLVAWLEANQ